MLSRPASPSSGINIPQLKADMPETTQSPKHVEEIQRSSNSSHAAERPTTPFSVKAILRLQSPNTSKHKSSYQRPKTPFSVEDILRLEPSKHPKEKSTDETSRSSSSMEDISQVERRLNDEPPKTQSAVQDSMITSMSTCIRPIRPSSAQKMQTAFTKSSGYVSIDESSCCSDVLAYGYPSFSRPQIWMSTPAYHWPSFNHGNINNLNHQQNPCNISTSLSGDMGSQSLRPSTPVFVSRMKFQIRFTTEQTAILEKAFERQRYISPGRRKIIAMQTQLTEKQVKTWYQNRRAKWKKQNLFAPDVGSTCFSGS